MKVAFDEHIPAGLARVFQSLAKERAFRYETGGIEVEFARDYAPVPGDADYVKKSDGPWLRRFSQNGGRAIITGNTKMRGNYAELIALEETGLIVIFFRSSWNQWGFLRKSALILAHWKKISETIKKSKSGEFWIVPSKWNEGTSLIRVRPKKRLFNKIGDRTTYEAQQNRAESPKNTSRKTPRKPRKSDDRQGLLNLDGNAPDK